MAHVGSGLAHCINGSIQLESAQREFSRYANSILGIRNVVTHQCKTRVSLADRRLDVRGTMFLRLISIDSPTALQSIVNFKVVKYSIRTPIDADPNSDSY